MEEPNKKETEKQAMHSLINEQALPEKVLGLPKTTLKISDFLEVLTGLRKFVIFMVIVYYRKRI